MSESRPFGFREMRARLALDLGNLLNQRGIQAQSPTYGSGNESPKQVHRPRGWMTPRGVFVFVFAVDKTGRGKIRSCRVFHQQQDNF